MEPTQTSQRVCQRVTDSWSSSRETKPHRVFVFPRAPPAACACRDRALCSALLCSLPLPLSCPCHPGPSIRAHTVSARPGGDRGPPRPVHGRAAGGPPRSNLMRKRGRGGGPGPVDPEPGRLRVCCPLDSELFAHRIPSPSHETAMANTRDRACRERGGRGLDSALSRPV